MDQEQLKRASALADLGNVKQAIEEFHALAQRTDDPNEKLAAMVSEASCLNSLRRFSEARAAAQRAKQISNNDASSAYAENEEAFALWGERRYEHALQIYDRIFSRFPRRLRISENRELYEAAVTQRGIILATVGRAQEALPLLEEALAFTISDEKRSDIFYNLGYCFQIMNQPEKAKSAFEQTLRLCTDPVGILGSRYNLGTIYANEGAFDKALHELEWCEAHLGDGDLRPDYVYGWLFKVLRAAGRHAEAERYRERINV